MPPRFGVCAVLSVGASAEPKTVAMDRTSAAVGRFIPVTYFVCLQKLRHDAEAWRHLQPEVRDAMPPCVTVGRSVRGWSRMRRIRIAMASRHAREDDAPLRPLAVAHHAADR